ncbi:transmembrane protein [Mycobacterium tuberculosis]|nr:transmembrane protein [Mycobacterium tuberculosis]
MAGPLFVGRVSATIKAAAPSTTAAIATLATAANGQLRERGGAGGWVGVHCPVVGGGVLVTRVRLLQLPCLCTPLHVSSLRWRSSLGLPWRCRGWGRWSVRLGGSRWFCGVGGRFRCRGRRSCGWGHYYGLGDAGQCVVAAYRFDQGGSEFLDTWCDAGSPVAGRHVPHGLVITDIDVGTVKAPDAFMAERVGW